MSDSVQRLTEASKAANAAIEALEAANKELEDKVRAKDKKIEALTKKCGEAESHLQEMTGSLDETASALAASEKAEKDLRARTSVLESQLASISEEIDTLRPVRGQPLLVIVDQSRADFSFPLNYASDALRLRRTARKGRKVRKPV
jgi:chromosome segregation ATPase